MNKSNPNFKNTISRAEMAASLTAANEPAIIRALESAGVEFIDENGGGPGLRMSRRRIHRRERRRLGSPPPRAPKAKAAQVIRSTEQTAGRPCQ